MTRRERGATPPPAGVLAPPPSLRTPLRPGARLIGHRVDALYLAFQGELSDDARADLVAAQIQAAALKAETSVHREANAGQIHGALSVRSREGWWSIRSAWLTVDVDERASQGWVIAVRPSALLLLREGPRAALGMARSAARALLSEVKGERLRRLDLCADLTGFDLRTVESKAFVCHRRTQLAAISTIKEYMRAGKRTGFVAGRGDALVRIYDKTEHLALGLDDTKAEDERSDWSLAGWNGRDDVTRVEFQLRGQVLEQLEIRDNPETALERLDAVWSYCTKKWFRLVELGTATRKERCTTDPRWRTLEDVVFRERSEPARRVRVPSVPMARRMVSAVVNFAAIEGAIPDRPGDPRERVKDWTADRAEAWIVEQLYAAARLTARAAAADLIARFDDAPMAAAHLMTRQAAAVARFGVRQKEHGAALIAA